MKVMTSRRTGVEAQLAVRRRHGAAWSSMVGTMMVGLYAVDRVRRERQTARSQLKYTAS